MSLCNPGDLMTLDTGANAVRLDLAQFEAYAKQVSGQTTTKDAETISRVEVIAALARILSANKKDLGEALGGVPDQRDARIRRLQRRITIVKEKRSPSTTQNTLNVVGNVFRDAIGKKPTPSREELQRLVTRLSTQLKGHQSKKTSEGGFLKKARKWAATKL